MASFATQVQIRRGTDAENDAFTGAEGEVTMDLTNKQLRVHDGQTKGGMKIPNINTVFGTGQIQDGAITESKLSADLQTKINEKTSGAGRNIGDIFWTTRTDSALNGAVEANGAQYNFADVNGGDNNVQALLESGALPSVSIAEFNAMVAEQGGCDSFGCDNLYCWGTNVYTKSLTPKIGDPIYMSTGEISPTLLVSDISGLPNSIQVTGIGGTSTLIRNAENDILADFFKVPKKIGRVLVRSQKPTADNNYTWYNLYSDGWVEQGGQTVNSTTVTLPITMADTNYVTFIAYNKTTNEGNIVIKYVSANTQNTTNFTIANSSILRVWQVSGYADPAEYTKDKWDYQNVQVERPMVQLFNSATDEAVATCTSVLADIAGLKLTTDGMIDYVVESQEPTEANGYTWYRLYKSGWVEQGGGFPIASSMTIQSITFPIEFSNTKYFIQKNPATNDAATISWRVVSFYDLTTTSAKTYNSKGGQGLTTWYACGMSAQ